MFNWHKLKQSNKLLFFWNKSNKFRAIEKKLYFGPWEGRTKEQLHKCVVAMVLRYCLAAGYLLCTGRVADIGNGGWRWVGQRRMAIWEMGVMGEFGLGWKNVDCLGKNVMGKFIFYFYFLLVFLIFILFYVLYLFLFYV